MLSRGIGLLSSALRSSRAHLVPVSCARRQGTGVLRNPFAFSRPLVSRARHLKDVEEHPFTEEELREAIEALESIKETGVDLSEEVSDELEGKKAKEPVEPLSEDPELEKRLTRLQKDFGLSQEKLDKVKALESIAIPVREDEVLRHVTNLIMRHGKKNYAQRVLSEALYLVHLKTNQDPVYILKEALEKMAPLVRILTHKDRTAKNTLFPIPLTLRQRTRSAWLYIQETAAKRPSKDPAVRLGEEIVAAFNGRSSGYDKRELIHRQAISLRSNVPLYGLKSKR